MTARRRPARARARWTAEDDVVLVRDWTEEHIWTIANHLGRSPAAVRFRAIQLGLGGSRARYWSMNRLEAHLGVSWWVVKRLAAELGLGLYRAPATYGTRRPSRGRDWGFTDEQVWAIEAELKRQLDAGLVGSGRRKGAP